MQHSSATAQKWQKKGSSHYSRNLFWKRWSISKRPGMLCTYTAHAIIAIVCWIPNDVHSYQGNLQRFTENGNKLIPLFLEQKPGPVVSRVVWKQREALSAKCASCSTENVSPNPQPRCAVPFPALGWNWNESLQNWGRCLCVCTMVAVQHLHLMPQQVQNTQEWLCDPKAVLRGSSLSSTQTLLCGLKLSTNKSDRMRPWLVCSGWGASSWSQLTSTLLFVFCALKQTKINTGAFNQHFLLLQIKGADFCACSLLGKCHPGYQVRTLNSPARTSCIYWHNFYGKSASGTGQLHPCTQISTLELWNQSSHCLREGHNWEGKCNTWAEDTSKHTGGFLLLGLKTPS